jgi:RNA-directed DNA polymerase
LPIPGDRHHAEELREEVAAVLAPLGLRLAPEKTAVVHIDEGFNFLGFSIRRQRKRGTQKWYVYTKPSRKAIQSVKDKVSAKTYRSTRHQNLDDVLRPTPGDSGLGELLSARRVQGHLQRGR